MLTYERFGMMRLRQFVAPELITELSNWEFMDQLWIGEAVGFTEWLRPVDRSDEVRSISLDLVELSPELSTAVFERLGLPLRTGMTRQEVEAALAAPSRVERFVNDRESLVFRFGAPCSYDVDCTIHQEQGLIYVVVMVPPDTCK